MKKRLNIFLSNEIVFLIILYGQYIYIVIIQHIVILQQYGHKSQSHPLNKSFKSPHHHSHTTDPPIPVASDAHMCPRFLLVLLLLIMIPLNLATD